MPPPRALVFGAAGGLGRALVAALPGGGFEVSGVVPGRRDCDLRDGWAVEQRIRAARPDVVFNAAGFTNVEDAERDPETAWAVNVEGAANVARAAAAAGARLVHYSTDFVFDGEAPEPYDEAAPPSPLGAYARGKAAGEARVAEACPGALVLRVGCLYGEGGRNFPSTIARRLRAGEALRCDDERLASPTWSARAAEVSAALAKAGHAGVFHVTAHGETTWAGFARLLAAELGLPPDRVAAVATDGLTLRAPRPRRAILAKRRLAELGLDTLGDWQAQARAYVASLGRA